jgi:hypothetical protein
MAAWKTVFAERSYGAHLPLRNRPDQVSASAGAVSNVTTAAKTRLTLALSSIALGVLARLR